MVGRIEDPKTLVEILIFGFKQSSASSPQIVFHLHHYRSVRDEDNDVVNRLTKRFAHPQDTNEPLDKSLDNNCLGEAVNFFAQEDAQTMQN